MKYTILTDLKVIDYDYSEEHETALFNEQMRKIDELGLVFDTTTEYKLRLNHHDFVDSLIHGIEYMALKEGADLVQFDNGNYGFVGYYGNHKDFLQIERD